jgi:sterol desaturase/sphingolipid hydroxylase (fatty acid hydroxylase superfamily)
VYHQWHHSCEAEALDKNFAGVLPLWDWLFGTLHFPAERRPSVFGVKEGDVPDGVHRQMVYPFARLLRPPVR